MAARSMRIAFLALASWAVLFAPGAAAADFDGRTPVDPERVAAAIIAPTFGGDGMVIARSCRDDGAVQPDGATPDGDASSPPSIQGQDGVAHGGPEDDRGTGAAEHHQGASTRAPPQD